MASLTGDDLDGISRGEKYPDRTVVRVFCMRTNRSAYPSGWAYKLHYGATVPDPPRTLEDGTIRRYGNSHEDTKGHELHVAPNPEPEQIEFPGMVELWERFWSDVPKTEFEVERGQYQVIHNERHDTAAAPDGTRTASRRVDARRDRAVVHGVSRRRHSRHRRTRAR